MNDGGASGPSNQASAEPAAEASAPAKPRNFSAVQVAAGEVRLEWEPSADPLTIVRFDYTDNGTNWKEATGSHSTTVSYTVSDLMDTTYTFAVRAVNSAGEGVSSDPWSVNNSCSAGQTHRAHCRCRRRAGRAELALLRRAKRRLRGSNTSRRPRATSATIGPTSPEAHGRPRPTL